MFGRRRPSSSHKHHHQANTQPPSSSAALAATKAFVRDRESNASLSSAAAAQALRTHVSSPTPVGDTVTKRMVRRGSISSHGSGSAQAAGLRRHSSSGSMTERSFRAPSPSRSSPIDYNAPPVPTVPKVVPGASVVHRRASSLDPPFRGGSPAARGNGRGVSLDRGVGSSAGRGKGHTPRVISLSQVPEDEQDGGPRSVNFSRPISPQQSPTPPRPATSARGGHSGWFGGPVVNPEASFRGESSPRPKTSSGVSGLDLQIAMQSAQNAADRPVSSNRVSRGVEGARLTSGSMRAKPSGTSVASRQSYSSQPAAPQRPRIVDPKSPYAVYDPSTRTFIHKQDAMDLHRELSQHEEEQHQPHHRASQPPPARAQQVDYRTPTPPPQYVQRAESPVPQARGRPPTPPAEYSKKAERREDVSPTPPSKTHTQNGPVLARQSSEDYAEADIGQPVDTNPSRRLDYSLPEPQMKDPETTAVVNLDSLYPRVGTPVMPTPINASNLRESRNQSLSPPRNAHFAAASVDLSNGIKHAPPPRSISPAKSALKPSPSVSRRNSSPLATDGRVASRGAPSEASDTMSEDGSKKKKKVVRVSFEEEPVIAGTSAYGEPETSSSPTGLSASKWSSASQEQDLDDVMKPRPVLPSFGSIREPNRRIEHDESAEKVTETVSSSMSTSIGSIGETSSDHALGGILTQDFANKNASHSDPLPPEVTSVEGSGYASDSDQSDTPYSEAHNTSNPAPKYDPVQSTPEPKTLTTPAESKPAVPEVPVIAIQLASPMEKSEPKFQRPFVPGGWDDDDESETESKIEPSSQGTSVSALGVHVAQQEQDESSDDNSSVYSDAYEDLSEDGGFASIDAVVESPVVEPQSGLMFSKYADSSSVVPPKSSLREEVTAEAVKDKDLEADDWEAARHHWRGLTESQKQQFLKGEPIEPVARGAPTVPAVPTAPVAAAAPALIPVEKTPPPKPGKSPVRHAQILPESVTPKPPKLSQPAQASAQPRKSALKKPMAVAPAPSSGTQMRRTMRGNAESDFVPASAPGTHMRKSMRAGADPGFASSPDKHMRKSMRSGEPVGNHSSGLAASRHSMSPVDTRPPKGALQKKNIPPAVSAPKARSQIATGSIVGTKPTTPAPTYDSDSDASASSFQRQRPRIAGGGFSRSSMRTAPTPTMKSAPTPTMRPISPPAVASPAPSALRKSMRPSSPTPEPAAGGGLKSSRFSLRSLSPAGRFRTSKAFTEEVHLMPTQPAPSKKKPAKVPAFVKPPKAKAPAASATTTRFKSRFADSDSEEEERPRRFQSRFADSDDEEDFELPPGLAPVRGIPRKAGEEDGDSTDLEDEDSDTEQAPAKDFEKGGKATINGTTNGEGAVLAQGSLRNSKYAPELPILETGKKNKAKRGFFGLGKKKTTDSQAAEAESEQKGTGVSDIPFPPAHRNRGGNRPLTPIGEDKSIEAIEPASRSPKLQRRSIPQWGRSASDSWPLPEPPKIGEEQRPQSSDGVTPRRTFLRPTLSKRNSSAISTSRNSIIDPNSGKEVTIGRTGKKKKFQGLRRVFGLND